MTRSDRRLAVVGAGLLALAMVVAVVAAVRGVSSVPAVVLGMVGGGLVAVATDGRQS